MDLTGSFRIFRAFGIDVHLHWAWFLLVVFLIQFDRGFSTPIWNLLIVLAIFGIVTLHEFGHALACRSVGGRAENIMLWPLGGVAFVEPPNRPGAVLWSIAAGPLVNVALVPILWVVATTVAPAIGSDDFSRFAGWVFQFNGIILIFNLLPIFPLDGGQILQSLLWFVVGRRLSMQIATAIGFVCAIAGFLWALSIGHTWLMLLAVFVGWQAWIGWQQARFVE